VNLFALRHLIVAGRPFRVKRCTFKVLA
jgi:hypothetical protein